MRAQPRIKVLFPLAPVLLNYCFRAVPEAQAVCRGRLPVIIACCHASSGDAPASSSEDEDVDPYEPLFFVSPPEPVFCCSFFICEVDLWSDEGRWLPPPKHRWRLAATMPCASELSDAQLLQRIDLFISATFGYATFGVLHPNGMYGVEWNGGVEWWDGTDRMNGLSAFACNCMSPTVSD